MPRAQFDILPGSMYSDIAEHALGHNRFKEVVNFRMGKEGEFESVRGYVESFSKSFCEIRTAIEISNDDGGRCIIYQDGYGANCVKRLLYDDGDGDGYENETPTTLTLPSGVTIGNVTLKFHYFKGVLRITGGSHPMWYGYCDKTINSDLACYPLYDDLSGGIAEYTGSNATISQYDQQADADGLGVAAAEGQYSLKVIKTTGAGYVYRTAFTMKAGYAYTVKARVLLPSGPAYDPILKCGAVADSSAFGSDTVNTAGGSWEELEVSFTPASAQSLVITLSPDSGSGTNTGYFDLIIIEEDGERIFSSEWYLFKAEVTDWPSYSVTTELFECEEGAGGGDRSSYYYAIFFIFDNGQYSLPIPLDTMDQIGDVDDYTGLARRFQVELEDSNWFDGNEGVRVTGVGLLVYQSASGNNPADPEIPWIVADVIDVMEDVDPKKLLSAYTVVAAYNAGTATNDNYHEDNANIYWKQCIGNTFDDTIQSQVDDLGREMIIRARAAAGRRVDVIGSDGVVSTRVHQQETYYGKVDPVGNPNDISNEYYFEDDLSSAINAPSDWVWLKFYMEPVEAYDSGTRYLVFTLCVNLLDLPSTTFESYTGIPTGTLDTNPDYTHYCIAEGRAWCNSAENNEADAARYSLPSQYDVFPNGNIAQTQFGGADSVRVVCERDNKIMFLKRHSITQMQYSGTNFYTDVALTQAGLYTDNGWIVIEGVLYFMDKDEVYTFSGGAAQPMLGSHRMRQYYQAHVDTDSFFAWNRIDRELWLVLSNTIMAFQVDYKHWYIRSTGLTPIQAFNLYDGHLILLAQESGPMGMVISTLFRFNHDQTTFDETVQASFITELIMSDPERYNKLESLELMAKGNCDVTISAKDPVLWAADVADKTTSTMTLNSAAVDLKIDRPLYLFRNLLLILETDSADDLSIQVRRLTPTINVFGVNA